MHNNSQSLTNLRADITELHAVFQQAIEKVIERGGLDQPTASPLWEALQQIAIPVAREIVPANTEHVTLALRIATIALAAGRVAHTIGRDALSRLRTFEDLAMLIETERRRDAALTMWIHSNERVVRGGAQILWLAPINKENGDSRVDLVLAVLFSYGWYQQGY